MEHIFLIVKVVEYTRAGYYYNSVRNDLTFREGRRGCVREVKFHSAHTNLQEALEIIQGLYFNTLCIGHCDHLDNNEYAERLQYMVLEMNSGDEISEILS